jgi:hypothetical protein
MDFAARRDPEVLVQDDLKEETSEKLRKLSELK